MGHPSPVITAASLAVSMLKTKQIPAQSPDSHSDAPKDFCTRKYLFQGGVRVSGQPTDPKGNLRKAHDHRRVEFSWRKKRSGWFSLSNGWRVGCSQMAKRRLRQIFQPARCLRSALESGKRRCKKTTTYLRGGDRRTYMAIDRGDRCERGVCAERSTS